MLLNGLRIDKCFSRETFPKFSYWIVLRKFWFAKRCNDEFQNISFWQYTGLQKITTERYGVELFYSNIGIHAHKGKANKTDNAMSLVCSTPTASRDLCACISSIHSDTAEGKSKVARFPGTK
mgnify:CR=1 FL=1